MFEQRQTLSLYELIHPLRERLVVGVGSEIAVGLQFGPRVAVGDEAATGAVTVTLAQRFGSALDLNIHLRMLCLDGVSAPHPDGGLRFRWIVNTLRSKMRKLGISRAALLTPGD